MGCYIGVTGEELANSVMVSISISTNGVTDHRGRCIQFATFGANPSQGALHSDLLQTRPGSAFAMRCDANRSLHLPRIHRTRNLHHNGNTLPKASSDQVFAMNFFFFGQSMAMRWYAVVIPSFSIVTPLACQQTQTGCGMGSQVSNAIHCPLSDCAEVTVPHVARRAIQQFVHKGQVITSEAQLAVIFGRRVVVASPNVSNFLFQHPGGESTFAEKDTAAKLDMIHPPDVAEKYAPGATTGTHGQRGEDDEDEEDDSSERGYTKEEVAKHKKKSDVWKVLNRPVLNVSNFLSQHPDDLCRGGCHRRVCRDPSA